MQYWERYLFGEQKQKFNKNDNKLYNLFSDTSFIPAQIAGEQYFSWSSLGFVRCTATGMSVCHSLSSPKWITLLLRILEGERTSHLHRNVVKQILTLQLLKSVLPHWVASVDGDRAGAIVQKLFDLLGRVLMGCSNDLTLYTTGELFSLARDIALGVGGKLGMVGGVVHTRNS